MKAYRKEKEKFSPVVLELETQKEVDMLFALFSYGPIIDVMRDEFDFVGYRSELREFMHDYVKYFKRIEKGIENG